jgi:hypothetical protein
MFGIPSNNRTCPINKIKVIINLYFPDLKRELLELDIVRLNYMSWMRSCDFTVNSEEYKNSFEQIYDKFCHKSGDLEKKASSLMDSILNH